MKTLANDAKAFGDLAKKLSLVDVLSSQPDGHVGTSSTLVTPQVYMRWLFSFNQRIEIDVSQG